MCPAECVCRKYHEVEMSPLPRFKPNKRGIKRETREFQSQYANKREDPSAQSLNSDIQQ